MKFLETRKMSSADRMLSSRAWLLALAFVISPAAVAQNSNQYAPQAQIGLTAPLSDLARQNMDRVAATAAQIKAVLIKDTGLMVELKRWVAKDATDHGQLITDSDLTDEAIFSRLETDVQFRSVATALVQKFGYLLPQVNPDSPQGKEQELLIKERAKWQAQDEEEQLTAARQRQTTGGMQQTQACDARLDPTNLSSNCAAAADWHTGSESDWLAVGQSAKCAQQSADYAPGTRESSAASAARDARRVIQRTARNCI